MYNFVYRIIVNDISLKPRCSGLHFFRRIFTYIFSHFYAICPEAAEFGKITQNKGHYSVQGHSINVTDFGTNRKFIYNFLLAINSAVRRMILCAI